MAERDPSRVLAVTAMALVGVAVAFFVVSAITMASWNYAVPRLLHSMDRDYDSATTFASIDYPTAMVTVLLFRMLIGARGLLLGAQEFARGEH